MIWHFLVRPPPTTNRPTGRVCEYGRYGDRQLKDIVAANRRIALIFYGTIFFGWLLIYLLSGLPAWTVILGGIFGYLIYGAITYWIARQRANEARERGGSALYTTCREVFANCLSHAEFQGVGDEGVADGDFGDNGDAFEKRRQVAERTESIAQRFRLRDRRSTRHRGSGRSAAEHRSRRAGCRAARGRRCARRVP